MKATFKKIPLRFNREDLERLILELPGINRLGDNTIDRRINSISKIAGEKT
jgi:hypothetical protein